MAKHAGHYETELEAQSARMRRALLDEPVGGKHGAPVVEAVPDASNVTPLFGQILTNHFPGVPRGLA